MKSMGDRVEQRMGISRTYIKKSIIFGAETSDCTPHTDLMPKFDKVFLVLTFRRKNNEIEENGSKFSFQTFQKPMGG